MAIPGAFMFGFASVIGQLIGNVLETKRILYALENEEKWKEERAQKKAREREGPEEWERRFDFLEKLKLVRRADPEKRIQTLRGEIEKVDKMLKKVDEEIKSLERGDGAKPR